MKVDIETIKVDQELTTEIDFNDYAIHKLRRKEGKRKDFKFKKIIFLFSLITNHG